MGHVLNEELSNKLSQLGTDLDQKLTAAETNMQEFMSAFEKFQTETNEIQANSGKKMEDVEVQIKAFQSASEGNVQDVMQDAEDLKVDTLKNIL